MGLTRTTQNATGKNQHKTTENEGCKSISMVPDKRNEKTPYTFSTSFAEREGPKVWNSTYFQFFP